MSEDDQNASKENKRNGSVTSDSKESPTRGRSPSRNQRENSSRSPSRSLSSSRGKTPDDDSLSRDLNEYVIFVLTFGFI